MPKMCECSCLTDIHSSVYIGLKKVDENNNWVWVEGELNQTEPLKYPNWAPNRPLFDKLTCAFMNCDRRYIHGNKRDLSKMTVRFTERFKWDDRHCDLLLPFLSFFCEAPRTGTSIPE